MQSHQSSTYTMTFVEPDQAQKQVNLWRKAYKWPTGTDPLRTLGLLYLVKHKHPDLCRTLPGIETTEFTNEQTYKQPIRTYPLRTLGLVY